MPTILFIHGGGFVIGDIDTHDNQCRTVCRDVGAVVLSVGYRLAPEAPFPAAVEDCVAALAWSAAHIGEFGGDPDRLAIAGDSAGGNLAAVTARLARDAGAPPIAAQLLIYPGTDFRDDDGRYPSREQNADGYFLTSADMKWFRGHYVGQADPEDPDLSPLLAEDLAGLPPAVVVTADRAGQRAGWRGSRDPGLRRGVTPGSCPGASAPVAQHLNPFGDGQVCHSRESP